MIKRLDCSNPETTRDSILEILGIDHETLLRIFGSCDDDIQPTPDTATRDADMEAAVYKVLRVRSPRDFWTVYFHATRAVDPDQFRNNGLRPVHRVLNWIWLMPLHLVQDQLSRDEWRHFRRTVETTHPGPYAQLFRMKTTNRFHYGPYGFLVRDTALRAEECGLRDYLGSPPEIVEDICFSFLEIHGVDLRSRYLAASRPCLIKFRVPPTRTGASPMYTAINYLYRVSRGLGMSFELEYDYDGKGVAIPPEQVEAVEILACS